MNKIDKLKKCGFLGALKESDINSENCKKKINSSKCYIVIICSKTMNEIGDVFLNEDDAIKCCEKMSLQFSASSSAKVYYVIRDLIVDNFNE